VDAADILLFNRNSQSFEFAAGNGFRSRVSEAGFHALGRSFASRVALERRVLQFRDPPEAQTNRELSALWKSEGFVTYTGVPLIAKGDLKGVLEIHHRSIFHPETQWTELVQNFSTQAAIAIENTQLFNDLQNTNFELSLAYDATIEGWARALELRENEPPGHFQRVTEMTLVLARAMGVRDSDLVHVRRGALLHDIGKMALPDPILRKTGPLSEEEWGVMRTHPNHARELLTPIAYLRPALDIPCYHHEKWDGSGYPNGLKGEQIPLAARVFAVADVFDASTSDRFHRKGISKDKALEYIKSESGKHFDPSVVGAFLQLLSKGQLQI
jgi:HD-GYP domain-containing protein (c-di-GMP phosphodiesterase class II)